MRFSSTLFHLFLLLSLFSFVSLPLPILSSATPIQELHNALQTLHSDLRALSKQFTAELTSSSSSSTPFPSSPSSSRSLSASTCLSSINSLQSQLTTCNSDVTTLFSSFPTSVPSSASISGICTSACLAQLITSAQSLSAECSTSADYVGVNFNVFNSIIFAVNTLCIQDNQGNYCAYSFMSELLSLESTIAQQITVAVSNVGSTSLSLRNPLPQISSSTLDGICTPCNQRLFVQLASANVTFTALSVISSFFSLSCQKDVATGEYCYFEFQTLIDSFHSPSTNPSSLFSSLPLDNICQNCILRIWNQVNVLFPSTTTSFPGSIGSAIQDAVDILCIRDTNSGNLCVDEIGPAVNTLISDFSSNPTSLCQNFQAAVTQGGCCWQSWQQATGQFFLLDPASIGISLAMDALKLCDVTFAPQCSFFQLPPWQLYLPNIDYPSILNTLNGKSNLETAILADLYTNSGVLPQWTTLESMINPNDGVSTVINVLFNVTTSNEYHSLLPYLTTLANNGQFALPQTSHSVYSYNKVNDAALMTTSAPSSGDSTANTIQIVIAVFSTIGGVGALLGIWYCLYRREQSKAGGYQDNKERVKAETHTPPTPTYKNNNYLNQSDIHLRETRPLSNADLGADAAQSHRKSWKANPMQMGQHVAVFGGGGRGPPPVAPARTQYEEQPQEQYYDNQNYDNQNYDHQNQYDYNQNNQNQNHYDYNGAAAPADAEYHEGYDNGQQQYDNNEQQHQEEGHPQQYDENGYDQHGFNNYS